jgi:hypothetical protein
MAKDSVTFDKFAGIKNTVTEERLSMGGRDSSGAKLGAELFNALNIDIDDAGQVKRRRGRQKVAAGDFHSLREIEGSVLVVKDGNLCRLFPNYTTSVLRFGVGQDRMSYVKVDDNVYFSSRTTSGVVDTKDFTVSEWGHESTDGAQGRWLSPVVNPTDYVPAVRGKLLGAPPNADYLAYFNGRIYLASGKTLWATELYLYNYVDKTRTFLSFEADITGVGVVTDGMYVGTTEAVYFLSGSFGQMTRIKLADVGMVPGSMVEIPADVVRGGSNSRNAVMFMTRFGVFSGLDGGIATNMTQSRVEFPVSTHAAPMYRLQDGMNQYVAVTNNGGTPVGASRIGDFVDVEIRRFQGA